MSRLKFERRPVPVLPEHRPLYKISQILLTLSLASRAGRSSTPRLHLFNWGLKSEERRRRLHQAVITKRLELVTWGFDPMLANALNYALGSGLIEERDAGYQLTSEGQEFVNRIIEEDDLFPEEKALFKEIGKGITETMIETASKKWGL